MHNTKVRTVGPMHNFFFSRMVHIMEPCYWLLMMFHLFGLFYNVRLFRSCFKDKTKYAVLQKSRPLMICQSILQLILLSLNANEATMAFTNKQQEEWCGTNSILMTSVGFLMIYNILAMLAIESNIPQNGIDFSCSYQHWDWIIVGCFLRCIFVFISSCHNCGLLVDHGPCFGGVVENLHPY